MFGGYIGVEIIIATSQGAIGQRAMGNVVGIVVGVALTKCVKLSVVGVTNARGTFWYSLDFAVNYQY